MISGEVIPKPTADISPCVDGEPSLHQVTRPREDIMSSKQELTTTEGELREEQLEQVSGGWPIDWATAPATTTTNSGKLTYQAGGTHFKEATME